VDDCEHSFKLSVTVEAQVHSHASPCGLWWTEVEYVFLPALKFPQSVSFHFCHTYIHSLFNNAVLSQQLTVLSYNT